MSTEIEIEVDDDFAELFELSDFIENSLSKGAELPESITLVDGDDVLGDSEPSQPVVFDIETEPLPAEEIWRVVPPFDESSVKVATGEFDPASVKLGRLKDEAKIKAKIDEARQAHEQAVADAANTIAAAKDEYEQETIGKAALSPVTGRILAIGYGLDGGERVVVSANDDESVILQAFWNAYKSLVQAGGKLVGFNSHRFDLPFIIRRSWVHDVPIPERVLDKYRYWNPVSIDLADIWKCGDYQSHIKLDTLAKMLGVGQKPNDISGADFARLWNEERERAIGYLANDIHMTYQCAVRLGAAS